MANIIKNIELFNDAKSAEELQTNLESYIEKYEIGHVVADICEAEQWFKDFHDEGSEPNAHWSGDSQIARFTISDEFNTQVRVMIEEISDDGNTDDYCYIVTVTEE